jgi:hypothetical protein
VVTESITGQWWLDVLQFGYIREKRIRHTTDCASDNHYKKSRVPANFSENDLARDARTSRELCPKAEPDRANGGQNVRAKFAAKFSDKSVSNSERRADEASSSGPLRGRRRLANYSR